MLVSLLRLNWVNHTINSFDIRALEKLLSFACTRINLSTMRWKWLYVQFISTIIRLNYQRIRKEFSIPLSEPQHSPQSKWFFYWNTHSRLKWANFPMTMESEMNVYCHENLPTLDARYWIYIEMCCKWNMHCSIELCFKPFNGKQIMRT